MKIEQVRDLVYILTQKEIKTRYKNSFLGYFWSLANPLAYATIFYFAFSIIFRFDVENYALFLICGLFPWQWLSNSATTAPVVFLQNFNLIKKAVFPRYILPVSSCLQEGMHFVLTIPIILLFMLIFGVEISPMIALGAPVLVVVQYITTLGLSLFIGTVNVFFRDMVYMVQVLFQMLFYMTPILYPMDKIPEEYRAYMYLNPFMPLIEAWRGLFLKGAVFTEFLLLAAVYSVVFLVFGIFVYRKLSWRFAEEM